MTVQIGIPRSNAKDLGQIRIHNQNRDPAKSYPRKIVAIDTETDNGDIFLIADSNGNTLEHPNIVLENILQFLLKYDEGYWVFFYNLAYDAECILKLLPVDILKSYRFKKELKFEYNGYTIHYIDRKKLSIRKGNHCVLCYDIAQYYENKPLTDAYCENIKKQLENDYLELKRKRKSFTLSYFLRHKKQLRRYCIYDCKLTKELAVNWVNLFQEVFGFRVKKWISAGYLAEKVLINNGIEIPFFNDLPYEIQELAWKSFYGGRFELIQRGFIGECYLYDINSAYPFALTKLPDILNGNWISSKKIDPNAALGFFHIRAIIDDSVKISPFPFRTKKNLIIYPVGEFETYVTLEELKAVRNDERISYKILDSYQFIPAKICGYPFKKFIEKQYEKRLTFKAKGLPTERAIKVILNSIYGKTAQRKNNTMGNLFIPVIAAFITGYTRAQLYRFVRDHNLANHVVAFATDSIATRKEIPNLDSKKLGEMKLDKHGNDAIFLSNGFYLLNGKWKNRGIGYDRERKVEIEHLDTKIGKDGQLYIAVKTTRTTHIKSGILYNRLKHVGKIEVYERKIKLNSDKKRFWFDELHLLSNLEWCDSSPINADLVSAAISARDDVNWVDEEIRYASESEL
jgi:hypothetical protein